MHEVKRKRGKRKGTFIGKGKKEKRKGETEPYFYVLTFYLLPLQTKENVEVKIESYFYVITFYLLLENPIFSRL